MYEIPHGTRLGAHGHCPGQEWIRCGVCYWHPVKHLGKHAGLALCRQEGSRKFSGHLLHLLFRWWKVSNAFSGPLGLSGLVGDVGYAGYIYINIYSLVSARVSEAG